MDKQEEIKSYLESAGQTEQDLLAGAEFFGATFIFDELIPKALKENKKIVWKDDFETGIGAMSYSLENI